MPSYEPTALPTYEPTSAPTALPSYAPTALPSAPPTLGPTPLPTQAPSFAPTGLPTLLPTPVPSILPTGGPDRWKALSQLYAVTGGDVYWFNRSNWMDKSPCTNSWFGVVCESGGTTRGDYDNVLQLRLEHNGLRGTIPTELGALTDLTSDLQLGNNSLWGSVPSQFGRLTKLSARLKLDGNFFGSNETEIRWPTAVPTLVPSSNPTTTPTPTVAPTATPLPSVLPTTPQPSSLPTQIPTYDAENFLTCVNSGYCAESGGDDDSANVKLYVGSSYTTMVACWRAGEAALNYSAVSCEITDGGECYCSKSCTCLIGGSGSTSTFKNMSSTPERCDEGDDDTWLDSCVAGLDFE